MTDAFTAEVVKTALVSLADEMALSVLRTAHSEVVRDTMDFSTAIFDGRGRLVAQGLTLPLHLGAMPDALAQLLRKYDGDIHPGDVFLLNDPEEGGMHLPDLFVFKPVFVGERRFAFAGCIAHHIDVGGRMPGSNAVDSTEIFQEGLQIPILKLYERDVPNRSLFEILERNVRMPAIVLGDLRAQLAACHFAEQGLLRLEERYGVEALESYLEQLLDYAERVSRDAIRAVPDGVYTFLDHIDDDGMGSGPIAIPVRLTVAGDELEVDLTGASPQVRSALNSTASFTKAGVYTALLCALHSEDVIANDGFYRPITIVVPKGTVLDGERPAPRAARALTGFRVIDAVLGALHQALPDRVPAAGEGGVTMLAIGGTDSDGSQVVFVEFIAGSWGAGPHGDGLDGTSPLGGNVSNVPVELLELHQPLLVEEYGYVPGTGGAGRFRGGLSIVRRIRFLGERGVLQMRSDRRAFPPYGLAGGSSGAPSANVLNPGGHAEVLPSKFTREIVHGDVIHHVTAGGGGWGDPRERDPEAVREDLLDGKITEGGSRLIGRRGVARLATVEGTSPPRSRSHTK
jgi:N-methylhydantoinase B